MVCDQFVIEDGGFQFEKSCDEMMWEDLCCYVIFFVDKVC